MDITQIKLSTEQEKIFDIMEHTNGHMFITGKAGTGKSALLQYFKQKTQKRVAVVAPTGVAALNVGGQTIHSFFRIPPQFIQQQGSTFIDNKTKYILQNIDTIVIDEVSMVRSDLMDAIDSKLRSARASSVAFGGVQIVMFGDLYQLPPVVSDPELMRYFAENNNGFYFFNASVWQDAMLDIYELSTIFRQKDEEFKSVLNAIRLGEVDEMILDTLNTRVVASVPASGVIRLVTTNSKVSEINHQFLEMLRDNPSMYKASIAGNIEQSSFPTEHELFLKRGAQIMMIKNDKDKRWVNGSIGYIESLMKDEIKVNIEGNTYNVPKETWNKIKYTYNPAKRMIEEEVISSFTQFPVRLAWAITIHKSQGQTYNAVAIDMSRGAFAHGQTYVALSRCTSLEGLYLTRKIKPQDIIIDPEIIRFMSKVQTVML